METMAFASFALLVAAWIVAPSRPVVITHTKTAPEVATQAA